MNKIRMTAFVLAILLIVLVASIAWAASSDGIAVDWSVLSGAGAPAASSSGLVTLNGSLGQTAIGPSEASHGSLGAGFWYGVGKRIYTTYLPLVLRNY